MCVFGLPNLNGSYIFMIFTVLFFNGCSRKCNDIIFTSKTSIHTDEDLLFPVVASEIPNSLQFLKKQEGVNRPQFLKCLANSAPADANCL